MLFEGFQQTTIHTSEISTRVRYGGDGPPLLLLHGHPQTHMMWHAVAPLLARDFTVIMPDLRGYGGSSKPPTTEDHYPYSKRAMAQDQIEIMKQLGHEQFAVVGHDRGGRCAYRLALDHPQAVRHLAVLDIIPTLEAYRRTDKEFAMGYWHWFFLSQPYDLPERLIGANPENYYFHGNHDLFHPEALQDYLYHIHQPETIHAMCEDYRAGATIDCAIDEADHGQRKIQCPVLALWGEKGSLPQWYDVLEIWREWADDVQGHGINSGHYLPEEAPEETYQALYSFLKG
ncbi:alpha/beta fold hydrolase [Paenibacillus wulumuqiensis]|uniref:alpha/beta fold hydrolase n=1 Tax=Paenibacillus wulumuqiensis TaxID=1567107 RepID=UPI000619D0FF|nr:alpha/beta hydrolase [Paenibacillus wulumuqiensis]